MPPAHRDAGDSTARTCPPAEEDLPIQFNEWATTWGTPTHAGMVELADRLKDRGVKYLIIDAGWYKKPGISWDNSAGDWEVSAELFPDGLKQTADAIRGGRPGSRHLVRIRGCLPRFRCVSTTRSTCSRAWAGR